MRALQVFNHLCSSVARKGEYTVHLVAEYSLHQTVLHVQTSLKFDNGIHREDGWIDSWSFYVTSYFKRSERESLVYEYAICTLRLTMINLMHSLCSGGVTRGGEACSYLAPTPSESWLHHYSAVTDSAEISPMRDLLENYSTSLMDVMVLNRIQS